MCAGMHACMVANKENKKLLFHFQVHCPTLLGLQQLLDNFHYTPAIRGVVWRGRLSFWTTYYIHPDILVSSIPGHLH